MENSAVLDLADLVFLADRRHRFAVEPFEHGGRFGLGVLFGRVMDDPSVADQPQSTQL